MEDRFVEENVRQRLIVSGMTELLENGIAGFSLRRAADAAQVSCAAPYRHFKSKEDYIAEIISFVVSKWELLFKEINAIYKNDASMLVIETCIANLRFRIANRNFPLALAHAKDSGKTIDDGIRDVVIAYSEAKGLDAETCELKMFSALSTIHGAVSMVDDENSCKIFSLARRKLAEEFK